MTEDPMLGPASSNSKPSREPKTSTVPNSAQRSTPSDELIQVARTLEAYGGREVAYDLALDLVLNEVVEQACSSTGATGAAIALARNGQMECRATTGCAAPNLGVRVESESGLSGACLKTGEMQHCQDTETDSRVDALVCRSLGVRSMLVLPLKDSGGAFGILEVLSERPKTFTETHLAALRTLAERIVESKRQADRGFNNARMPEVDEEEFHTNDVGIDRFKPDLSSSKEEVSTSFSQEPAIIRSNVWTTVLVVLIIVTALALGVVIGWRGAAQRWAESRVAKPVTPAPSAAGTAQPTTNSLASTPAQSQTAVAKRHAELRHSGSGVSAPTGGLVVTENGKVIYRIPPSAGGDASASAESSNRLVHRVDPVYPDEARAHHVQGPVILDVQVLRDGSIGNIEIVEGNPLLAEAAVEAVRRWKYQPYYVDGHPVQSQTRITVSFSLTDSD